jgi:uncharacterized lipoprotein YmbA
MTRRTWLSLLLGCAWLTACASPATRFYTLAATDQPVLGSPVAVAPVTVGVGPVSLPGYVDRPEIVTRTSPYRIDVATFDQWAEPLVDKFPAVLVTDLAALLPGDRVISFPPLMPAPVDLQIEVTVSRFDVDAGGLATLLADWRVQRQSAPPLFGRTQAVAQAADSSMAAQVAVLSQTVAGLASDLAAGVAAMRMAKPAS